MIWYISFFRVLIYIQKATIFDYLKNTFIIICVNIILEIVLSYYWNSLPDSVISANTIGVFENRLDRFLD